MREIRVEGLRLGYDKLDIVTGLDVLLRGGEITALVGPNGCGKSTLLRGIARILKPRAGAVYLDGHSVHRLPTKELARRLGILPQTPSAPEGMTVRELVAQGRFPHQGWLQQWSARDEEAVHRALEITGMLSLADRAVDELSGGQRQRAWIAMTLAQETEVLLLDEPTTFLDMAHQLEVLQLLQHLNGQEGRTIVMVLHDLNQAARYAHRLVVMSRGEVFAAGSPREVITPQMLREVFGVEARILVDPESGAPYCLPLGLCSREAHPAPALDGAVLTRP